MTTPPQESRGSWASLGGVLPSKDLPFQLPLAASMGTRLSPEVPPFTNQRSPPGWRSGGQRG